MILKFFASILLCLCFKIMQCSQEIIVVPKDTNINVVSKSAFLQKTENKGPVSFSQTWLVNTTLDDYILSSTISNVRQTAESAAPLY